MLSAILAKIPQHERKYWNIGVEQEPPVTQKTAPSVWEEYLKLHRNGQWLLALVQVNRLVEYDPKQVEIWRVKARLHGVLGHCSCCICAIEALLQLTPNDLEGLRMQVMFLHCNDSLEQALSICDTVLATNPGHADFWALKADILKSHGRHEDAARACRRALKIHPDCVAALRIQETLGEGVNFGDSI